MTMINVDSATKTTVYNTHQAFVFIIKVGNYLGLLPVNNISSCTEVKFDWKSSKSLYSYVKIVIFIIHTIACVINWTCVRFNFRQLAIQMHYVHSLIATIVFIKLAKKWPKFSKLWYNVDEAMNQKYGCLKTLYRRIKLTTVIFFLASLIERILWFIYRYKIFLKKNNNTFNYELFYIAVFPSFFSVFPFSGPAAIFVTITTLSTHLIWSFNDLFIISVSTALALRFKQITNRLYINEKKANSNNYWIELRADYDRLVHLAKKLDKYISHIVFLSYSTNLFFLLIKLSNVLGHFNHNVQIIYYTYSFIVLIARIVVVSLYGAWISEESKEPAICLNSVPSATYNLEIRRLLLQISFNDVAITGNKMFKVTRGLLLNVAGAVVTYELVMFQFNNSLGSN